jgi:hypothetical protein
MDACVAFFKRIDPKVRFIRTLSGDRDDTCYFRDKGRWVSVHPSERSRMAPRLVR